VGDVADAEDAGREQAHPRSGGIRLIRDVADWGIEGHHRSNAAVEQRPGSEGDDPRLAQTNDGTFLEIDVLVLQTWQPFDDSLDVEHPLSEQRPSPPQSMFRAV